MTPYLRLMLLSLAGQQPSTAPATASPLYDLLPEHAVVAFCAESPQRALPGKLLDPILNRTVPKSGISKRVKRILAKLPGPMLLALLHTRPGHLDDGDWVVAARVDGGDESVDALLEKDIVPLLNEFNADAAGDASHWRYKRTGNRREIFRGEKAVWTMVSRAGHWFGATDRKIAGDWERGEFPQRRWTADGRVRGMIGNTARAPMLRVMLNPAPLLAEMKPPGKNSPEWLMTQLLSPQDVRGIMADVAWDSTGVTLDVIAALSDQVGGIGRALGQPSTNGASLSIFPADFIGIGRIAMPSAAELLDGAYAIMDRVDPDIGAEYRAELSDFHTETGVQFHKDLLANLVREAAFGVRINFTKPNPIAWTVAIPLADAEQFSSQLDALLEHYAVPIQHKQNHGMDIRAGKLAFPFVYTVASRYFLLADSTFTLGEINKNLSQPGPRPQSESLDGLLTQLSFPHSACVLVNMETLGKSLGPMLEATGPARPLLSTGVVGLSLDAKDGRAHVRLAWLMGKRDRQGKPLPTDSDESAMEPVDMLATLMEGIAGGVTNARSNAQRTVVMSNMRAIGQGLYIFAGNNKDRFPADLKELVDANIVTLKQFRSPYDQSGPATVDELAQKGHFIYRAGMSVSSDPREIILAERAVQGDGACFLFVDGHAEFIAGEKAQELIGRIEQGAESVQP